MEHDDRGDRLKGGRILELEGWRSVGKTIALPLRQ
jgi:hypothetical protein